MFLAIFSLYLQYILYFQLKESEMKNDMEAKIELKRMEVYSSFKPYLTLYSYYDEYCLINQMISIFLSWTIK